MKYILIYIYIYILITACVARLAKASDTQAVGCGTHSVGSSLVLTIKIGLQIIFISDLI